MSTIQITLFPKSIPNWISVHNERMNHTDNKSNVKVLPYSDEGMPALGSSCMNSVVLFRSSMLFFNLNGGGIKKNRKLSTSTFISN